MQRSRINLEIEAWMVSGERIEPLLRDSPSTAAIALDIHLAGEGGIPCEAFAPEDRQDLETLASEFVIILDREEPPTWHPVIDLTPTVVAAAQTFDIPPRERPQGQRHASRAFLESIASLSAAIDLGGARLNRDGSLNRRDRPTLREIFSHLSDLGEGAQEMALDLALDFLSDQGLLLRRDGALESSPDLPTWLASLDDRPDFALRWWESRERRTGGIKDWIATNLPDGADADFAARLFFRREGLLVPGPTGRSWTQLPRLLREALVVGILERECAQGDLVFVWPWIDSIHPRAERTWWCTSDLQIFLAPQSPLGHHRDASFLGKRESADLVSRWKLDRDKVLAAAALESWAGRIPTLLEDLAPPAAVLVQLEEWLATRRACRFESARLLRIADPLRHRQLCALDAFLSLTLETIPDWGFLIDPTQEPTIRRLLSSLGYFPPEDPSSAPVHPWKSPAPEPELREHRWSWPNGEMVSRTIPGSSSRYAGTGLRELDYADCMKLAEYAALTENEIEVVLKTPPGRAMRLRPLRVDRRREPATLEAILLSTGERRDVAIESIRKIGLLA